MTERRFCFNSADLVADCAASYLVCADCAGCRRGSGYCVIALNPLFVNNLAGLTRVTPCALRHGQNVTGLTLRSEVGFDILIIVTERRNSRFVSLFAAQAVAVTFTRLGAGRLCVYHPGSLFGVVTERRYGFRLGL